MKISKLFHWLYAILMFLPILVFIPNGFYYGFNQNVNVSDEVIEVNTYYKTNEVNNYNDLKYGNIYTLNVPNQTVFTSGITTLCLNIYLYNFTITSSENIVPELEVPYITRGANATNLAIINLENNNYRRTFGYGEIDIVYNSMNSDNFNTLLPYLSKCNRQYIKSSEFVTINNSISNSMSYAWKSTWQNELFSWSYDSFLTQPFLYITNLFNVPATNTLLYCLSYWLNISIIWLCFDVVMYVPLLVHRWLDKGIVE